MIKVELPEHLRILAGVNGVVLLEVSEPVSTKRLLDALETRYPQLRGTVRDHQTRKRRAYVRFFACETDLSFEPDDASLPEAVKRGEEPFLIIGAMSGG